MYDVSSIEDFKREPMLLIGNHLLANVVEDSDRLEVALSAYRHRSWYSAKFWLTRVLYGASGGYENHLRNQLMALTSVQLYLTIANGHFRDTTTVEMEAKRGIS